MDDNEGVRERAKEPMEWISGTRTPWLFFVYVVLRNDCIFLGIVLRFLSI